MTLTRESEQLLADMPLLGHGLSLLVPGTYALVRERLEQVEAAVRAKQAAEFERLRAERDGAYRERAALVSALIRVGGYPSLVVRAPDTEGWWIVYADTPAGQVSWHISPDDMDLFRDFTVAFGSAPSPWDGHDTAEKYRRVAALAATPVAPAPAATERCAGCGHETRFHADGQCDCEGDGEAGLCPCPEPRP